MARHRTVFPLRSKDEAGYLACVDGVARLLERGGVIAFPADTVWGLGASALAPRAIAQIRAIKGRGPGQPFPLFIASALDAWTFTGPPTPPARALADAFWPGQLTLILPLAGPILRALSGPDGSVGLRVPGNAVLRDIVARLGAPMVQTSANRTGTPPLTTADAVEETLGNEIDTLVEMPHTPRGRASSVVRPLDDRLEILREGAISRSHLLAACGLEDESGGS